jgi:phage shock protein PspC (stress-responsive transcriptional regulator)
MAEQKEAQREPAADLPPGNRFFSWMRGLGIVRQNGWIGGVCAGIAARLGIDPLIVRGIAVVVVILGGPALLLYAAAWLLLPDAQDDIHLERLMRGHFEPAVVAIAVIALLTLLPVTQGIWWAGSQFWGEPFWPASFGRTLWTLLVIGAIVAVVIWAARTNRFTSRGGESGTRTASVSRPAPGSAATTTGTADATTSAAQASAPAASPVATAATGPVPPDPAAPGEDLEAWKRRQAEWKAEHDAWRTQQAADQRTARIQRSAEIRARARAMAAEAEEARRLRRASNPRTSAAFVGIAVGLGILAGAVAAAIAAGSATAATYAVSIGFAVATLTIGLSIIVAGAMRRRSGFLTFVSIALIVVSVATALPPRGRDFVLAYGSHDTAASTRVYMPVGSYLVNLDPKRSDGSGSGSGSASGSDTRVIDIDQGVGSVQVSIVRGITVEVQATQTRNPGSFTASTLYTNGTTSQQGTQTRLPNGLLRTSVSYGASGRPDVIVRIHQWVGSVNVSYEALRDETRSGSSNTGDSSSGGTSSGGSSTDDPTPSPTAASPAPTTP